MRLIRVAMLAVLACLAAGPSRVRSFSLDLRRAVVFSRRGGPPAVGGLRFHTQFRSTPLMCGHVRTAAEARFACQGGEKLRARWHLPHLRRCFSSPDRVNGALDVKRQARKLRSSYRMSHLMSMCRGFAGQMLKCAHCPVGYINAI